MKSEDDGWRGFLKLSKAAKSEHEIEELFELFLTFEEREALADRYLIVKELLKGEKSQREMAKDLKVSIAKITRGSNFLKTISKDLRRRLVDDFKNL